MAYPFAGFGTFLFLHTEQPIWDTDTGWLFNISVSRQKILGALSDSVMLMSPGSNDRTFELYMSPDRVAALQALIGTTADFCDWFSPVPTTRPAFLQGVTHMNNIAAINNLPGDPTNTTQRRQHIRVTLVSQ